MVVAFILIYILLVIGLAWFEGRGRTCGFLGALLIMLLSTPLIGYFLLFAFAHKDPVGCKWCGNVLNEALFCGNCAKNPEGISAAEEIDISDHLISDNG